MQANKLAFNSRRSCVVSTRGSVACSQPIAAQIGLDILKRGGNAADAAVAVAAALNVTEPTSTGIGGDAFCLYFDSSSNTVKGINGSGRCPLALSIESLLAEGYSENNPFPYSHGHAVTVPGAAATWVDTIDNLGSGKMTLSEILQPAITLAEEGFPVQEVTAHFWNKGIGDRQRTDGRRNSFAGAMKLHDPSNKHGGDMLLDGKPPKHGDIMKMPKLAETFLELSKNGKKGFYEGRIAQAVVDVIQQHGGVMSLEDLKNHETTFDQPISVDYKGCRVWEMPPNGQGITALMTLNILESYDLADMGHNSTEYLHLLIEALRLSFKDTFWYVTDPEVVSVPVKEMLSKEYASKRRQLIDRNKAGVVERGSPTSSSDTVYLSVVDGDGNACSFINSNYMGFGTGIMPEGCGFTLQNRGVGFSLDPNHPNALKGGKRPYHTIIPAMVTSTETGELLCCYGVMGGYMQPQGHAQVLINMVDFHMDPQQALDAPRICIGSANEDDHIDVEEGISEEVVLQLKNMGHTICGPVTGHERSKFGRGQVITRGNWWKTGSREGSNVLWAGSDSRADGQVAAF